MESYFRIKKLTYLIIFFTFSCCSVSQVHEAGINSDSLGVEADFLTELEHEVGKLPNVYSFILYKDGKLLSEKYYNGADKHTLLHLRSITKSVTSLLIGKLGYDRNILSLGKKIIDYYPDVKPKHDSLLLKRISIHNILDMNSGFEWNENTEAINWYTSIQNPTEYIFSKEIINEPGSVWNYNSGAVHLLFRVFENSAGKEQTEYAEEILFNPLGINSYSWDKHPENKVRPDAGLSLKATDLAKIGLLFLDKGSFNGNQVIPEAWITEIEAGKIDLNSTYGPLENLSYNNLWWIAEYDNEKVFFALGYAGQLLIILPDLKIVMVGNHEFRINPSAAGLQGRAFINTALVPLIEHIK